MKRKLILLLLAVVAACACAFALSACGDGDNGGNGNGNGNENGTYYLVKKGKVERDTFITLDSGKWKDSDFESGSYEKSGNDITLYEVFMGEKEVYGKGSINNGVLALDMDENGSLESKYCSEAHNHVYGNWKPANEVSCFQDGTEERECACGVKNSRVTTPAIGHHTFDDWGCNETGHWQVCSVCGVQEGHDEHNGNATCTVCEFPLKDTEGLDYSSMYSDVGYTITGMGSANVSMIRIPATYNGLPVTGILSQAFMSEKNLKYVIIPDGVTEIGNYAFEGCINLKGVTIPDSVTFIGEDAFKDTAYYNDESNWQEGVLYIGRNLVAAKTEISGNYYVKSRTVSIASSAFYNCSNLTSITIPDGVTEIGNYAFNGCSNLTSITIPDSVTRIGRYAFSGCSNITSITIPDNVTEIGNYAFKGCSSLTSITIPDGVTEIGDSAFSGCSSLTSITIPDSVTKIGDSAFSGCSSLTSITIPNGVTKIGNSAFSGCSNLHGTVLGNVEYVGNTLNPYLVALKAINTDITSVSFNEKTKFISRNAFDGCTGITSAEIPAFAIRYIPKQNLKTVTITDNTTYVGGFEDCSSLESITIPDGVTEIGYYAFEDCSSLTSITIPESVRIISPGAFAGCNSLANVTFTGTKEQWDAIIGDGKLINATITFLK